ncbi:40-residue YVTN family beta-propeller repeat-containing protein [Granulicella rosea]|uniref:40-residue YVTN family beta-propeller repeat-containing protein n=1 Tax=Granulicella rosea TaxID=474952 RepID=A0A239ISM7_9BACT|nr:YncE family protein [Granulicella rosea]SNS96640.1 40-residue YVTN family beta-propeller repeat-containing protein [Granulicella rosea]
MNIRSLGLAFAAAVFLNFAAVAQQPEHGALLVVTKQSHALAIVDADTLKVIAQVPIGEDPHEVVVGPDGRTAYVSNYGEGTLHTLAVVDLIGRKPLPPIDITPLRGAHGLFVHEGKLWFTAEGSKAVATLDPVTGKVESVLGTGQDKTHLVWVSRSGWWVIASNAGSGTLSVFGRTLGGLPVMVPGAPAAPASYSVPGWKHTLIPDGAGAEGFAVSPDERDVWVGAADGTISVIRFGFDHKRRAGHRARPDELLLDGVLEPATTIATITPDVVGANRLKFTPDGKLVLITTHTGKDLVVVDAHTRQVVKRIPIEERGASGIQVQPDGKRAFIACPRDHYVAVVDLERLEMIAKIDAGREPDGLAWWGR